ncbi:MAG: (4Fe-4S)-binding protein [Acidobacteria bacterium]|nr:(4Fe-4S)-binding protein [Acidobacteriota bacterium]
MSEILHKYEKDGVTVVWRPALCTHSAECVRGLGAVFNPKARPWINMDAAPATRIAEQVGRCPSGALSLDESGTKG